MVSVVELFTVLLAFGVMLSASTDRVARARNDARTELGGADVEEEVPVWPSRAGFVACSRGWTFAGTGGSA